MNTLPKPPTPDESIRGGSKTRELVVVDLETTGLQVGFHVPLEIAAINVLTGKTLYFVPHVACEDLGRASGDAMRINRYYERGVYQEMLTPNATHDFYGQLWEMLAGNTFGGSNPRFDAAMLMSVRAITEQEEPWHHRLADLSAYAGAALRQPPNALVGLGDVCKALHVDAGIAHSALDDASATAQCFRKLSKIYTEKAEQSA